MNSSRRARALRFRTAITSGRTFLFTAVVVAGTVGCRPPGEIVEGPDASNPGSGGHGSGSGGNGAGSGGSGSGGNGSGGSASGGTVGSGGSSSGGNGGSGGSVGSGGSGVSGSGGSGGGVGGRSGTGGAGGASAGGHGGAAASSSGGTSGQASCTNAVMDGSETGVDCGGSCPACVAYKVGAPNSDQNVKNACEGGGTGFICPRFMMFSPEMKQAAADDAKDNNWPAGSFNYAVVTLNGAKCCECFQIVYSNPQNSAVAATPPKPVIGQNFNQGGANNAFDVFMGKGGLGAQQAGCSKMYSTYPGTGEPNSGGIKATNLAECKMLSSQACVTAITNQCSMIKASTPAVEKTTQNSCLESNLAESLYHENWNVKAQRIECPVHLTEVTGCRLNGQNLPKADPAIQTASQAGNWMSYGTTTMQDCCKPSCSWPGNVSNTMSPWSTMYQCSMNGNPMTK